MSDNTLETQAATTPPVEQQAAEPLWPFITSEFGNLVQHYIEDRPEFAAEVKAGVTPYEQVLPGGYKLTMNVEAV